MQVKNVRSRIVPAKKDDLLELLNYYQHEERAKKAQKAEEQRQQINEFLHKKQSCAKGGVQKRIDQVIANKQSLVKQKEMLARQKMEQDEEKHKLRRQGQPNLPTPQKQRWDEKRSFVKQQIELNSQVLQSQREFLQEQDRVFSLGRTFSAVQRSKEQKQQLACIEDKLRAAQQRKEQAMLKVKKARTIRSDNQKFYSSQQINPIVQCSKVQLANDDLPFSFDKVIARCTSIQQHTRDANVTSSVSRPQTSLDFKPFGGSYKLDDGWFGGE